MAVCISGPGPNPHWNIPWALEILQGMERSGILLIEELDGFLSQRNAGKGKHPEMMGTVVAAIMVTSFSVEVALKTLQAQSNTADKPLSGHDLVQLFCALPCDTKRAAQHKLETIPPIGQQNWIGESPKIRDLIKQGRSSFTDWRYLPEKTEIGGGVPKVHINVAQALRAVILDQI